MEAWFTVEKPGLIMFIPTSNVYSEFPESIDSDEFPARIKRVASQTSAPYVPIGIYTASVPPVK